MYTITNVGGTPGGEAFLLVTEEKAALIDSGFACSAGRICLLYTSDAADE